LSCVSYVPYPCASVGVSAFGCISVFLYVRKILAGHGPPRELCQNLFCFVGRGMPDTWGLGHVWPEYGVMLYLFWLCLLMDEVVDGGCLHREPEPRGNMVFLVVLHIHMLSWPALQVARIPLGTYRPRASYGRAMYVAAVTRFLASLWAVEA
jgi:hypothetical protein